MNDESESNQHKNSEKGKTMDYNRQNQHLLNEKGRIIDRQTHFNS